MMLNQLDRKQIDRLYALLEREKDPDSAGALRWALSVLEGLPVSEPPPDVMTKRDYLITWGYLQTLKDVFENRARDAAARGDEIGRNLTADYMKQSAEITSMQGKIDSKAQSME